MHRQICSKSIADTNADRRKRSEVIDTHNHSYGTPTSPEARHGGRHALVGHLGKENGHERDARNGMGKLVHRDIYSDRSIMIVYQRCP